MKAIDAVANLRKLADILEKHRDAEIRMSSATVWFNEKESFLAAAKDFPRPFNKEYDDGAYGNLKLQHGKLAETGSIRLSIPLANICELIKPAQPSVYKFPPIVGAEEESELEAQ